MSTETIGSLKKHAANLDLSEPMTITQNGKPAYTIETYEVRKCRDEAIALMKLLSFSIDDQKHGRVNSGSQVRDKLAKRKQSAQ
ncbi:type II toxin-antitoxin system Phd/YefM family antitoxin [Vibrio splendidus]|uniref:prevent-host-death protein n=1 Tax=Vibrio splendidus TaxID=29497 RepID=UPI000C855473|nr:prevent-host-death protein [Vibrio splendidus]PMI77175.1 prevent-host-death protein [Vibrio splendidus]PMK14022.1 prevent-host-death protein [Vibrio splendidus]PMK60490.1 prevent-host-death protein [Vibrio splendidus]